MNRLPVAGTVVAASDTFALRLGVVGARMAGEGLGELVGLPNVQFGAAGAVETRSGIGVAGHRHPILAVGLAVDPFDVVRTLSVAVSRSVFSASFVGRMLRRASVRIHRNLLNNSVIIQFNSN